MGGYVQYKYGTFFPIVLSLWSILALSSTLASEAKRGSLEFVAAAPISRRRIVLEKLSGHILVDRDRIRRGVRLDGDRRRASTASCPATRSRSRRPSPTRSSSG